MLVCCERKTLLVGSATARRAWASNGPCTALLSGSPACGVGPGPRRKYQNDLVGLPGLACLFLPCRALCAVRRAGAAAASPRLAHRVQWLNTRRVKRKRARERRNATRPNGKSRHPTIRRAQQDDNKNPAVAVLHPADLIKATLPFRAVLHPADPIKATTLQPFRAVFSRLPLRWRWVCFLAVIRPRQQAFREPAVRRAVPVRRGGRVQSPMTAQG